MGQQNLTQRLVWLIGAMIALVAIVAYVIYANRSIYPAVPDDRPADVVLPMEEGTTWKLVAGYIDHPGHAENDQYNRWALDFVTTDAGNDTIVAPISGTVKINRAVPENCDIPEKATSENIGVVIDAGNGWSYVLDHLGEISIEEGPIEQGAVIGKMGDSGCTSRTQLHFALWHLDGSENWSYPFGHLSQYSDKDFVTDALLTRQLACDPQPLRVVDYDKLPTSANVGQSIRTGFVVKNINADSCADFVAQTIGVEGRGPGGNADIKNFPFAEQITIAPQSTYRFDGERSFPIPGVHTTLPTVEDETGAWHEIPLEDGRPLALSIDVAQTQQQTTPTTAPKKPEATAARRPTTIPTTSSNTSVTREPAVRDASTDASDSSSTDSVAEHSTTRTTAAIGDESPGNSKTDSSSNQDTETDETQNPPPAVGGRTRSSAPRDDTAISPISGVQIRTIVTLYLRLAPGGEVIGTIPPGSLGEVITGPITIDAVIWHEIDFGELGHGWVADPVTEPEPPVNLDDPQVTRSDGGEEEPTVLEAWISFSGSPIPASPETNPVLPVSISSPETLLLIGSPFPMVSIVSPESVVTVGSPIAVVRIASPEAVISEASPFSAPAIASPRAVSTGASPIPFVSLGSPVANTLASSPIAVPPLAAPDLASPIVTMPEAISSEATPDVLLSEPIPELASPIASPMADMSDNSLDLPVTVPSTGEIEATATSFVDSAFLLPAENSIPVEIIPPTETSTPTEMPTETPEPTWTNTPTEVPTNTPEPTATDTPTEIPTNTPEPTLTDTPTEIPTDTPEPTWTSTPTEVPANTPEPTWTNTPTDVPTDTPEPTLTNTATEIPTETPEPTITPVEIPTADLEPPIFEEEIEQPVESAEIFGPVLPPGGDESTSPGAFGAGHQVTVLFDAGLYEQPDLTLAPFSVIPMGFSGIITDGPVEASGIVWYQVDAGVYGAGWLNGSLLQGDVTPTNQLEEHSSSEEPVSGTEGASDGAQSFYTIGEPSEEATDSGGDVSDTPVFTGEASSEPIDDTDPDDAISDPSQSTEPTTTFSGGESFYTVQNPDETTNVPGAGNIGSPESTNELENAPTFEESGGVMASDDGSMTTGIEMVDDATPIMVAPEMSFAESIGTPDVTMAPVFDTDDDNDGFGENDQTDSALQFEPTQEPFIGGGQSFDGNGQGDFGNSDDQFFPTMEPFIGSGQTFDGGNQGDFAGFGEQSAATPGPFIENNQIFESGNQDGFANTGFQMAATPDPFAGGGQIFDSGNQNDFASGGFQIAGTPDLFAGSGQTFESGNQDDFADTGFQIAQEPDFSTGDGQTFESNDQDDFSDSGFQMISGDDPFADQAGGPAFDTQTGSEQTFEQEQSQPEVTLPPGPLEIVRTQLSRNPDQMVLVDGNPTTVWYMQNTSGLSESSLTIDLGSVQYIGSIKWQEAPDGLWGSMKLEISTDSMNWNEYPVDFAMQDGQWTVMQIDRDVQYVRFVFQNDADASLPQLGGLAELEIWP